jgi:hypothetical protein
MIVSAFVDSDRQLTDCGGFLNSKEILLCIGSVENFN